MSGELTVKAKVDRIQGLLTPRKDKIVQLVGGEKKAERMTMVFLNAMAKTPKLLDCTPGSLMNCFMTACEYQLEPNTPLAHCYLIPYKDQCTIQLGYRGLIELCLRSGIVTTVQAREVRENDRFTLEYGFEEKMEHKPALTDRGKAIGVYAVIAYKDGSKNAHYLPLDEALEHAAQYSQAYRNAEKSWNGKPPRKDSPWHTNLISMAMKTAVIQALKWAPRSVEDKTLQDGYSRIQEAVQRDEAVERGESLALPWDDGESKADALSASLVPDDEPEQEPEPEKTTRRASSSKKAEQEDDGSFMEAQALLDDMQKVIDYKEIPTAVIDEHFATCKITDPAKATVAQLRQCIELLNGEPTP